MGLDISIKINNPQDVISPDYFEKYDHLHNLSRTFCNLMSRQNVVEHETELSQISKIIEVDISAILQMDFYPSNDEIEFRLEFAKTEEEKTVFLSEVEDRKALLSHNLDRVLDTINILIEKLSLINNLPELLIETDFDSLDYKTYFSNFNIDTGDGYMFNNFGQDLRNFKRFLEYVKLKGTTTVWFDYG